MKIELPDDIGERIRRRAAETTGTTPAEIIRRALDSLDWQDGERAAIQVGIEAMNEGRVRPFEEFDREFRKAHGIPPAE